MQTLTVNFGSTGNHKIGYRPNGSTDPFSYINVSASPAIIPNVQDTDYEVTVCTVCSDGNPSAPITLIAPYVPALKCLSGLKIEVKYVSDPDAAGAPCGGGHQCNQAEFYLRANSVYLVNDDPDHRNSTNDPTKPSTANLNNMGGPTDTIQNDDGGDRSASFTITADQAMEIAKTNGGLIDIALECALDFCHNNVTWIVVTTSDGREIYNGCPTGNFLNDFNPCQ